jgi:hypothetical protein
MPTGNYDSSRLTQQRQNYVLYTWNRNNAARVNAGLSIRREQPNTQLATVVTERRSALANNTIVCPCDAPTQENAGGGNCQNWNA